MRLDDYLSTVGVIKRRTVAKELASSGLIEANNRKAKAAYTVQLGDMISIKGSKSQSIEVLEIPTGSVSADKREKYFKII
jgi:ribosome-associated heat shock protein Hsp15